MNLYVFHQSGKEESRYLDDHGFKSLDEEKEKGKKRKYDTKEEAEAAAGDDKDKDPDYVQSEEGSSQDPLYEPSQKELKRANKEGDN